VLKNIHEDLPEIQNDITLIFKKLPNEITCKVEYREELFRKETVEQFVNHILNLLSTVVKDPDIPIRYRPHAGPSTDVASIHRRCSREFYLVAKSAE
jgi:hypothetical protein